MSTSRVSSLVAFALAGAAVLSAQDAVQHERLTRLWETKPGLKTPESVLYDPAAKVIYVSNVNDKPWEKDGNGFISKLSPNGEFIEVKWLTGLSAPKGLGIVKGKLYVSDIDELVEIDLEKAKILNRYKHETAKNLNDVTTGPNGEVYVSDSGGRSIFTLKDGKLEPLIESDEVAKVNGLLVADKELLVGLPNSLSTLDVKAKKVSALVSGTGGIDGIVAVGDGSYVISDWAGKVQLVQAGKASVVLLDTTPKKVNAADIELIADGKILLVPTFFDDKVVAYKLK